MACRWTRPWRRYREALPHAGAGDLLAAIQGDWYFRIPAIRLAEAHASVATTASTFVYEFAWKSPEFDGRLGACHGLEIPFVFDTLGRDTGRLVGANPPQPLADAMHAAWVGFRLEWGQRLAKLRFGRPDDHALRSSIGGRGILSARTRAV